MFWTRRQPSPAAALDTLFATPETDRHVLAEQMVGAGAWRQAEVDEAIRLARRLQTFVQEATVSFVDPTAVPEAVPVSSSVAGRRPRARRRRPA